ncbi:MAG: cellulose biosynthesis protein BcsG [Succinivibrio sp.]
MPFLHLMRDLKPSFRGLGIWNAYFIFAIGLYYFGYTDFSLPLNLALAAALCLRLPWRAPDRIWRVAAALCALMLLYHDSYLPAPWQILSQRQNIAGFSLEYVWNFVKGFVNVQMVAAALITLLAVALLGDYVRFTTVTVACLAAALVAKPPFSLGSQEAPVTASECPAQQGAAQADEASSSDLIAQRGEATDAALSRWRDAFYASEEKREVRMPQKLEPGFAPFSIVIVNICSLSEDDLAATALAAHPVFKRFDLRFEEFNSASPYSTPASMRLLRASCGQMTEGEMYSGRRDSCELMTQLSNLGFRPSVFLDHNGQYGDYLKTLGRLAGLPQDIASQKNLKVAYRSFDGSPVFDDGDLFRMYERNVLSDHSSSDISFFNLIALHDGNRYAQSGKSAGYPQRLAKLLDDLDSFMDSLERSRSNVMLMVVPEHGAQFRGDRMQIASLREIPTSHITRIPVLVRFFGDGAKPRQLTVKGQYSYLALSDLVRRAIENNYYGGKTPLDDLIQDLPQTWPVSEGTNAEFLKFRGKEYYRLKGEAWAPYSY